MNSTEISRLLKKYLEGSSTAQENAMLESWYMRHEDKTLAEVSAQERIIQLDRIRAKVVAYSNPSKTIRLWPRYAAVAAAVTFLAICVYFFSAPRLPEGDAILSLAQDLPPGKNAAILTLANGHTLTLSSAKTGVVIDATKLTYNDGSSLVSNASAINGRHAELVSVPPSGNATISTPRGGTYQVVLPDGTKVWLNAASSLKFPVQFSGKERRIVLDGEAYFAVVHNAKQPFKVETKGQLVEDIGTEFNINAYADEISVRTTLVKGSARVLPYGLSRQGVILKPNQQSINAENTIKVKPVETADAVAWKDGRFRFSNASLEDVMKQLARWYDVEIEYPNGIPDEHFSGGINRNAKASEALEILKYTKVDFKIEGRKIIVHR